MHAEFEHNLLVMYSLIVISVSSITPILFSTLLHLFATSGLASFKNPSVHSSETAGSQAILLR